jgi:hypothetical protein
VKKLLGVLAAAFLALPLSVQALSVSGTLNDSPPFDFNAFTFTVGTAGFTTLFLSGDTDPFLILFSGTNTFTSGTYISQDDDNGGGLNSMIATVLPVGTYTAYITTHGTFWDGTGFLHSHDHTPMNYTLTISGDVAAATVPEGGASVLLLGLAAGGLALFKRSKP